MLSWLLDLWNSLTDFFTQVITALNDFLTELETLTEQVNNSIDNIGDGAGAVKTILGATRYAVGDPVYYAIYLSCLLGLFYSVYVLVTGILKTMKEARLNAFKFVDLNKF